MNEGYWESPDTWNCGHADQKRYGVEFVAHAEYSEPEGYFANLCQECVRQNNVPYGRVFELYKGRCTDE